MSDSTRGGWRVSVDTGGTFTDVVVALLLAPTGLPVAAVVLVLHLFLGWSYRGAYRPVLAARVTPG